MLKLLHLADLHLDSRFVGLSLSDSVKRRAEMRNIFKNALELAKTEGCSVVLISGDLFDSEYYTKDTLDFLRGAFASVPDIRFFIAPGNHDPYNAASPYRLGVFPENVTVFDSENMCAVRCEELSLTVYGYAFTSSSYTRDPLEGFLLSGGSKYNVLCAHTELDVLGSSYAPIASSRLGNTGLDYAALGHIHTPQGIARSASTVYAYSGCIAGRDYSEYGEKGGIIVTIEDVNGKKEVKAEKITLCPWIYTTESVDITDAVTQEDVVDTVTAALKCACGREGVEYVVRLRLTGEIKFALDTENILNSLAQAGVKEVRDETVSFCGVAELENDFSLRGEFFKVLKDDLASDDVEKRRIAQMALKYGLAALNGSEIDV